MLVPLYRLICQKEGINGASGKSAALISPTMQVDQSRVIDVTFATSTHGGLGFKFIPLQKHIQIHPGERKLVYFLAENKTGHDVTVQAVPSITPSDAARFLKKTECFCFTQQFFFNKEKAEMPVYFFIEPEVSKNIREVTLAYTLFDATGFEKKGERYRKGRIEVKG